MDKTNRKFPPRPTKPGFIAVEVVDAADGGFCLVVGDTRVAGCHPALHDNNVRYRWNVRAQEILRATALALTESDPEEVA